MSLGSTVFVFITPSVSRTGTPDVKSALYMDKVIEKKTER